MWSTGLCQVAWRSSPGTWVSAIEPGEKPSLRFHSVGSIGTPATLRGIPAMGRCTRRPVSVVGSGTVKTSFGNGSRQAAGSPPHHGAVTGTGDDDGAAT